ncbi:unnamed protein product [Rotaria sp. Silwood1]|nr:unnamed protein product [Rotaria sp. Silwood1]CAF3489788.1 unnamed protein product [Rotaria sp. Silwood1]CAF5121249.1 unnamed protein product [Rotaria sp. Silwood1]
MVEGVEIIDTDKTVLYAFRFGTSNKLVHLTQQQLNRIPYLFNLVAHKDDFLLVQNENGEYVLRHPIEYNWFMPILCSITSEQSYTLFSELVEDDNVLDALQLFDYLGIDPFPLPLLKDKSLVLSNPIKIDDDKKQVNDEAQSARSGRFNTLPKRLKVDKCKHRFGPKAQKYR